MYFDTIHPVLLPGALFWSTEASFVVGSHDFPPSLFQGSPLPGACVCYIVSKDGKPVIHTRAYGISRKVGAENLPVRSDTVFPIGPSFFKNMLTIIIMQLVREGRVKLDDNVQEILKDVKFRVR